MQSALSSPVLDSPNSSADFTLDTTGELTVEDVKDFLMWALFTHLFWSIRVAFILGSPQCFASLGLWMKLRITTGTWLKRMGGLLEFSSAEASWQTAGGEEHLQHKQALWSVESRQATCYWRQKGGVPDWGNGPCWAWRVFNVQIHARNLFSKIFRMCILFCLCILCRGGTKSTDETTLHLSVVWQYFSCFWTSSSVAYVVLFFLLSRQRLPFYWSCMNSDMNQCFWLKSFSIGKSDSL